MLISWSVCLAYLITFCILLRIVILIRKKSNMTKHNFTKVDYKKQYLGVFLHPSQFFKILAQRQMSAHTNLMWYRMAILLSPEISLFICDTISSVILVKKKKNLSWLSTVTSNLSLANFVSEKAFPPFVSSFFAFQIHSFTVLASYALTYHFIS